MIEAYIGRVDSENFNFIKGDWSGNIPERLTIFLPRAKEVFGLMIERINDFPDNKGKQVDWGAFVLLMKPVEISDFLASIYNDDDMEVLNRELINLNSEVTYALVGVELY